MVNNQKIITTKISLLTGIYIFYIVFWLLTCNIKSPSSLDSCRYITNTYIHKTHYYEIMFIEIMKNTKRLLINSLKEFLCISTMCLLRLDLWENLRPQKLQPNFGVTPHSNFECLWRLPLCIYILPHFLHI